MTEEEMRQLMRRFGVPEDAASGLAAHFTTDAQRFVVGRLMRSAWLCGKIEANDRIKVLVNNLMTIFQGGLKEINYDGVGVPK